MSRLSPPPSILRLALVAALGLLVAPATGDEDALVRALGPAQVDWTRGLVRVRAGAAADLRMPGADAARADSQRRARKRASVLLREALADLPLGPGRKPSKTTIEKALPRARTSAVDYQSNGGVMLELELGFADLEVAATRKGAEQGDEPAAGARKAPDGLTIAVPTMPLEAMPTLLLRKEELTTTAVYRLGDPPRGATAVRARRDRAGRLLLPAATASPPAQVPVLIYVRTIAKR